MDAPRIVILGGGFAGAYCAQALERRLGGIRAEVLLIDEHNYFVFSPLLVEAGTGSLEPRHAVVAIRAFLKKTSFRMGRIQSVDLTARRVVYQSPSGEGVREAQYDHLVIALGSVTRVPDLPGLREHACEMKGLTDAVALRDRAILLLEAADAEEDAARRRALIHFVVVGGSFTGAEVAGEFDVFLKAASRKYRGVGSGDCRVTLVEIGERILPALDPGLSAFAAEHMRRRGIDVRLRTSLERVEADAVTLSGGERLAAHTVIWCAGIAQNPLVEKFGLPLDARGFILCEPDLRVRGREEAWAIGDCAVNVDPTGRAYPATAQHAIKQGQHLARNLALVLRGKPPEPCIIRTQGALAALGCRTGVARVFGIRLAGFAAWALWRSVYLMKMPGVTRKLRVALDWTMDLFFARDFVQLGVHRRGE